MGRPVSATVESLTPDLVSVTECHSHKHEGAAHRASVTRDVSILLGRKPRLFSGFDRFNYNTWAGHP